MSCPAPDQVRFDLVTYHKSLIAGRPQQAALIEQKYGLTGHPPKAVSLALEAASRGYDPLDAADDHLEGSE